MSVLVIVAIIVGCVVAALAAVWGIVWTHEWWLGRPGPAREADTMIASGGFCAPLLLPLHHQIPIVNVANSLKPFKVKRGLDPSDFEWDWPMFPDIDGILGPWTYVGVKGRDGFYHAAGPAEAGWANAVASDVFRVPETVKPAAPPENPSNRG